MKRWLTTGSLLLAVGLLKIRQHVNAPMTLEDYLAFRCGSATESHGDSFLTFFGHCWGCPVAAVGAAMIIATIVTAVKVQQQPARRAVPVRRR